MIWCFYKSFELLLRLLPTTTTVLLLLQEWDDDYEVYEDTQHNSLRCRARRNMKGETESFPKYTSFFSKSEKNV